MTCEKCGSQIKESDLFCMGCGTPLSSQCANCGTKLPTSAKFCSQCGTGQTSSITVVFHDKNLEAVVREVLKIPEGSMTREDLKRLTTLDASGLSIENILGLEDANNLTQLVLSSNRIRNLRPLASLSKLEQLYLRSNPLNQESTDTHVPKLKARGVSVT